ncbi:MAG: four helix bundle protein [Chloroflexota bacterium]
MNYDDWLAQVPENLKRDPLWQFQAYQKSVLLYDLAWQDCERLQKDLRGRAVAQQLIRSAGSVCANIEEGYGRGYGREYAYFLRVAIGSARETRGWYYRTRKLLATEVVTHRMAVVDEIVAMLVPVSQKQRRYVGRKANGR